MLFRTRGEKDQRAGEILKILLTVFLKEVWWSSGQSHPCRVRISARGLPTWCGLRGGRSYCNNVYKIILKPKWAVNLKKLKLR